MVKELQKYELFKYNVIKHLSESPNQTNIINEVKRKHEMCICSSRRQEDINSPSALIRILEKRNCLSAQKLNPLQDISNRLNNPVDLVSSFDKFQCNSTIVGNEQTNNKNKNINELSHTDRDAENKRKISQLLTEEIGRSWRDLGRNLSIKEADLDGLHEKFPSDLKSKILEMLQLFETQIEPSEWFNTLCDALKSSRRNDLKIKIMKIYRDNP